VACVEYEPTRAHGASSSSAAAAAAAACGSELCERTPIPCHFAGNEERDEIESGKHRERTRRASDDPPIDPTRQLHPRHTARRRNDAGRSSSRRAASIPGGRRTSSCQPVLHDYSESMSAVTGPSLDLPFPPANGDGVRADGCDHKLHGSHIIYDHTQIRDHARCRYLNACSDSEYRRPAEVRLAASPPAGTTARELLELTRE
jgi:hypothetical protein